MSKGEFYSSAQDADELDRLFEGLKDEERINEKRNAGEKYVGSLTTEQYYSIRKRMKTDLFFLCGVLGFDRLSPNLHGNLCKWMHDTKEEQYREILLPRSHFKSTVATIAHAIQIVLPDDSGEEPWPYNLGTNCRVLIGHETSEQASRFLYAITAQFLGNPLLMAFFPECVPNIRKQKVNKHELELPRSERWPEPTIDTMGVGGRSQGRHYNYLKLDDLFGDKARDSNLDRESTISWFDNVQSFFSYHSKDKFDLVGTRWSMDDLYAHAHKVYGNQLKRYIRPIEEYIQGKDGVVTKQIIFPEEFNSEKLEILKKNRKVWTAQYLNDPREGANEFDESWLCYYGWKDTKTIEILAFDKGEDRWKGTGELIRTEDMDKLIFVDPAVTGDYGYIVTGTDYKKRNFVLKALQQNWTPPKFIDFIFQEFQRWNPRFVGIESVLFSSLYEAWMIREQQFRGIRFKIEPLLTKKQEKPLRVKGLSNYFSSGQILLHESQIELIDQYKFFGSISEYHMLDALAYGPKHWKPPVPPHIKAAMANFNNMNGRGNEGYSAID